MCIRDRVPCTPPPHPAVLCLHGHGMSKDILSGVPRDDAERERMELLRGDYAAKFARAGYITISPDAAGFGDRTEKASLEQIGSHCRHLAVNALSLGMSLQGIRIWEILSVIDYLAGRTDVDINRIAGAGLSMGCEHLMYAADITRTIPVSGSYTDEQKAVYSIVLDAQKEAINSVKPGQNFENLQNQAIESITKGLRKLGLLKGTVKALIETEAYKDFYMHGIGHWLGMDVHDVGAYMSDKGKSKKFEAGMVLTIEPGIYISKKNKNVDKIWRGIGVRIEDDVLVTKSGCDVLSGNLPKEIDDIERRMSLN